MTGRRKWKFFSFELNENWFLGQTTQTNWTELKTEIETKNQKLNEKFSFNSLVAIDSGKILMTINQFQQFLSVLPLLRILKIIFFSFQFSSTFHWKWWLITELLWLKQKKNKQWLLQLSPDLPDHWYPRSYLFCTKFSTWIGKHERDWEEDSNSNFKQDFHSRSKPAETKWRRIWNYTTDEFR